MAALEVEIQGAEAASARCQQQQGASNSSWTWPQPNWTQLAAAEAATGPAGSGGPRATHAAPAARFTPASRTWADRRQQLVDLQRRHAVASERAKVLQDLERRKEGLGPGVKRALAQAQDSPLGPLGTVRGMVADLLRVDVRMAPLIDVALGDLTQFIVVQGPALAEALAAGELQPKGRVGMLDLSGFPSSPAPTAANLTGRRAVIGRADEFVECDPAFPAALPAPAWARRGVSKRWPMRCGCSGNCHAGSGL